MRKNQVFSMIAVTLSWLLAFGAPIGLAAQEQNPSPALPASAQTQPGQAQDQTAPAARKPAPSLLIPAGPDYTKDIPWFPHSIRPYMPQEASEAVIVNSPRLEQLIRDGKLYLSLDDAIQLAIENNLDISVQRYSTWLADVNVLRSKSGAPIRSSQGFTSVLGTVPTPSFDPVITSSLGWSRASIPVNNPFTAGTGTTNQPLLISNNATVDFGFQKGFESGTALGLTFNNIRSSSTSPAVLFNPAVTSSLVVNFSQQLLNGFGFMPNTRYIIEAKNDSKAARYALANSVMNDIVSVENSYWNLAYAIENVRVQQASVTFAQKLLEDNQRQLQIGTLAQLDVVQAESALATNQQNLIVAQTTEQQQETVLLNLITRNPMAAGLENVQVTPTDSINAPPKIDIIPYRDAVAEAWDNRPDLLQSELTLKNDDLEVKVTRNALLPILTLTGQYGTEGLAGNKTTVISTPTAFGANTRSPIVNANGQPVLVNGQAVYTGTPVALETRSSMLPAGLLDSFDTLWNNHFPTYSVGLNMTLPLRNRSAQADNAQALLQQRSAVLQLQELKNNIAESVRNAQIAMQQGLARVQAAIKATQLAQQTLDDEQKKFQLGVSTDFFVIQYESQLLAAQGNELQAKVGLIEAIVAFNQALGRTLQAHNISIADAATGHVTRVPRIPGTPDPALGRDAFAGGQR